MTLLTRSTPLFLVGALCFLLAQEGPAPTWQKTVPPASNDYALGTDSLPKAGVPAGKTFEFTMSDPKIFPGTRRTISVYVPAEYRAEKPACVYVGLDGLGFHAATVFDNLIAQHAMPVTIGIGVSPGTVESAQAPEDPRFDRSFEFDSLNDRLARFLLEDVFPAVEQHRTPDGHSIMLSKNGNDRMIGGGSTGGIGAFTVAWQRPDEFQRVFTAIGTFVGMRGGEGYYVLVRKTEPKPLRIFMEDGAHDEWPGGPEMGDWWMSNQTMERALEFAGYDLRHIWGVGTHSDKQASAVFPDAMRWLWRDWPSPIKAKEPGNPVLQDILRAGDGWQVAAENCAAVQSLAADAQGRILLAGVGSQRAAVPLGEGKGEPCPTSERTVFAVGPDGHVNSAPAIEKALGGKRKVQGLTIRGNRDVYVTADSDGEGEVWLIRAGGEKKLLDKGLHDPSGIVFSPDGLWLMVIERRSGIGYSYRVQQDGTLNAREPFFRFVVPGASGSGGAAEAWMDQAGRPYVATSMGVQVFDRNGRVTAILPLPNHAPATALAFGGADFKTLYVAGGGRVYCRKLRMAGAPPWAKPSKLPSWGAG